MWSIAQSRPSYVPDVSQRVHGSVQTLQVNGSDMSSGAHLVGIEAGLSVWYPGQMAAQHSGAGNFNTAPAVCAPHTPPRQASQCTENRTSP